MPYTYSLNRSFSVTAMASAPRPASSSSSLETILLSDFGDLAPDDLILCSRPKRTNQKLMQVARTCYTGPSEQDTAKDGKQDGSSQEDERYPSTPMSVPWLLHVPGSSSWIPGPHPTWSATCPGPAGSAAAAYQAHDRRVLSVAGVGTVSRDNFRITNELAECGYLVMFDGGWCAVMEQSSGKIVGKGRLHDDDGLYHLEFLNIPQDDKACEGSTAT